MGRISRPSTADSIRAVLRRAIEDAVPEDAACLQDGPACMEAHPIHQASSRDGRLVQVYADVDGMLDVIMNALYLDHPVYLSTGCLHEQHEYCRAAVNRAGDGKVPGTCKFCAAPCICSCHG